MWTNENPQVDTRSRESNPGPYDCEADALPHDHGHQCFIFIPASEMNVYLKDRNHYKKRKNVYYEPNQPDEKLHVDLLLLSHTRKF